MIRHRIAVDTPNQLSLVPVDSLANNLIALSQRPEAAGTIYHLTADRYYSITELTRQISTDFGYHFREFPLLKFVALLNQLAEPEDPVFPLLDFFNRSTPHIAAMTHKRYDNRCYRSARDDIADGQSDPTLAETARRLVRFLQSQGWIAREDERACINV
jgi:nucleoside-diphosphate-sugar epimerase